MMTADVLERGVCHVSHRNGDSDFQVALVDSTRHVRLDGSLSGFASWRTDGIWQSAGIAMIADDDDDDIDFGDDDEDEFEDDLDDDEDLDDDDLDDDDLDEDEFEDEEEEDEDFDDDFDDEDDY